MIAKPLLNGHREGPSGFLGIGKNKHPTCDSRLAACFQASRANECSELLAGLIVGAVMLDHLRGGDTVPLEARFADERSVRPYDPIRGPVQDGSP